MRAFLAIFLFLVCFKKQSHATFGDFIKNLPSDIAHAFSSAWDTISDAVKKPVRIKRIGQGGRLKTTASVNDETDEPKRILMMKPVTKMKYRHYEYTEDSTKSGQKVTIPILRAPVFNSLREWIDMQKPYYARKDRSKNLKVEKKIMREEVIVQYF
ncbi:hypothetical protein HF086_003366 [Spodoptera exigua]|uniref:Uncharacterized protein n=1 Tax=Spodoptera exigua TaxID=7107 RepID=A0A922SSP2_SPOEX|nr:hypothetical protein HF086_003366 [Spodoptera exigua]